MNTCPLSYLIKGPVTPHRHSMKRPLTHPTHITALSQHLVSFQQVVSHQLADFVLSLPASLDHLHLCLCRRLPLKVLVICSVPKCWFNVTELHRHIHCYHHRIQRFAVTLLINIISIAVTCVYVVYIY